MAPTTAAERQRKYRARLKSDPERREKYLQSERERWRKNVEEGKKKAIKDLSKREQRQKRKMWRAAYKRSKERRVALKNLSTPPHSPDQGDHPEQSGSSRQRLVAQKRNRKEKNKLKRQIKELKEKWVTEEKEMDKKKEGEKATVKVTIKKSVESTQEDLVELFHSYIKRFKQHHFNIKQQYAFYRELKKNMSREEALIHVDFSENYSCKYSSQVQAVHFGPSHQQATLHTGVLYVGRHPEPVCFCTISPSRYKSPPAIWQHLHPVLDYLHTQHPQVSVLHFLSDGPCTQYKQRGNFFLFTTELDKRGFKAGSWNFFEASHGKGAPDGVGGALKRTADMMVAKGRDIPDALELYNALTETNTTVKLFFVKSEDVEEATQKMPKLIPAVPGTMRIHQVITLAPGELISRDLSCMCTTRKQFICKCFNTQCFSFGQKITGSLSL
ncbi:hypothetical protein SRHO_G00160170 [Serrasalmus rhombeus]